MQDRVELLDEIQARKRQMSRAFFVPLQVEVGSGKGVLVRIPHRADLMVHAISMIRLCCNGAFSRGVVSRCLEANRTRVQTKGVPAVPRCAKAAERGVD